MARVRPKRPQENTLSLINIVFLMLIFFLIAGQLSPPVDPSVSLAQTTGAPPLPPPDALFADAEGVLRYRGQVLSAEAFMADHAQGRETAGAEGAADDAPARPAIRLAADRALPAVRLLTLVDALYAAGAGSVSVVTVRATP
ncbi:ExbD/TolR family protein [Stappia indica]|uniref:ExbD/TolR family protein n=1 Tax=Stappia indica TaxID=538381 RepID=UPI001CD33122|nr:biopolymer transporter ExbD [Stappia indica]MCA1300537.1 biopolymer transporter ExbD [Stappia indica]